MSVAAQIREFYDLTGKMKRSGYHVVITTKPGFDRNRLKAELTIDGKPRVWTYDFRERLWDTHSPQNEYVSNGNSRGES